MNITSPAPTRFLLFQIGSTFFFGLTVCVFSLNGVLRNIGNKRPGTKLQAKGLIQDFRLADYLAAN